jgi:hypothetical protein
LVGGGGGHLNQSLKIFGALHSPLNLYLLKGLSPFQVISKENA